MKKILFITTQYRTGERIYPILPSLSKEFEVHLLKLYQMDPSHKWPGSFDIRFFIVNVFLSCFLQFNKKRHEINI